MSGNHTSLADRFLELSELDPTNTPYKKLADLHPLLEAVQTAYDAIEIEDLLAELEQAADDTNDRETRTDARTRAISMAEAAAEALNELVAAL